MTTTIQQTGKAYKLQAVVAMALIIIGGVLFIGSLSMDGDGKTGAIILGCGIVWRICARIGAWWNHG